MAFGGTFGPDGALFPFAIIFNIKGEQGSGYDANGRIKFTTASGREYTPERVDTLLIFGSTTEASDALGGLEPGAVDPTNGDTGEIVTAAPAADQHGLPTNFGPGRGNWASPTGGVGRFRVLVEEQVTAPADEVDGTNEAQGGVTPHNDSAPGDADMLCDVRNFHITALSQLSLRVECIHSVQG